MTNNNIVQKLWNLWEQLTGHPGAINRTSKITDFF